MHIPCLNFITLNITPTQPVAVSCSSTVILQCLAACVRNKTSSTWRLAWHVTSGAPTKIVPTTILSKHAHDFGHPVLRVHIVVVAVLLSLGATESFCRAHLIAGPPMGGRQPPPSSI